MAESVPGSPDNQQWLTRWALKDVIFVAVTAPIVVAALLEWFLWLAAFCYCFAKAWKKADHWTSRMLATFMGVFFILFRGIFLPVMIVTLPLPAIVTQYFPKSVIPYLQDFAFWTFAILLVVPWFICVFQIVVNPVNRREVPAQALDAITAPKVVVVMPVYKEPPESLIKALNSVVECTYPSNCIHVFVSFDGDSIDELYLKTIECLGVPITLKEFPKSIDVAYNGVRVTVSRFKHGGKRHCQKATFRLIDKIYKRYIQSYDDLFILFIDSDCILDKVCIQNFMYEMELKPGCKKNMLAMTGIITSSTAKHSFITLLQDMEYIHGQMYDRSIESGCGAVTCLPGALTILRFSAFRNMARFYFSDKAEQCEDLFDYGKTHLGEDRWLTHLFMLGAKKRYQIQLCTRAFCKTEAVQTFRSLLKQRRRWFLGFITNEVCMLSDIRLWRKYPVLCMIRLMQNTIRTTALLFLIMIISLASNSSQWNKLPFQFMALSLGLNWVMMLYFAVCLRRWKAAMYPLMFLMNPFMNWIYMVYGIFTAGQRTWGGPRADAGAADAKVSPQEAIEHARETGDELNVIPETFKPAIAARRRRVRPSVLQPSSIVEGQFATDDHLTLDESEGSPLRLAREDVLEKGRKFSDEVFDTSDSEGASIHTPRRVPDRRSYDGGQINQQHTEEQAGVRHVTISHSGTEMTGAEGRSTPVVADELSRKLIALAEMPSDATHETSPLGRWSPMIASGLDQADASAQQPTYEADPKPTSGPGGTSGRFSSSRRRNKLQKRKTSPKR